MRTVGINWVVFFFLLNGNWHTGFEACIRACVIFHTSNYVKVWRAGWHCFSVACEGTVSNNTNREFFFLTDPLLSDHYLEATEQSLDWLFEKHSTKQTWFNLKCSLWPTLCLTFLPHLTSVYFLNVIPVFCECFIFIKTAYLPANKGLYSSCCKWQFRSTSWFLGIISSKICRQVLTWRR